MVRWKISTDNRVGMVHDVLRVFATEKIDIIAMEVIPEQIHIKMEEIEPGVFQGLGKRLCQIPGVYKINYVQVMPQEEREQQLRAVLDSISEGIIAINQEEQITTLNPAAEKILHRSSKVLLNKQISDILGTEAPIITSLQDGKNYDNQEMIIDTPEGQSHYLTSGRPIRDEQGHLIGAVAVMKDIDQVRQLIYKMTRPSTITFDDIICKSTAMEQVIHLAQKTAVSNSSILIRGESGTGKELFARAIHAASLRREEPFVPINCAALPDTLLESELFGYEAGTFTGGRKGGKQGIFELAHGGTLFLDEIGELPTHLQVKLLRVLQEGKVRRVGGSNEQPVDVRIITASNRNLEKMIEHQEFREDLYYRLNVIPVHIPPLRQRKEDIALLVDYFLQSFAPGSHSFLVQEEALHKLLEYDWPGNVRELRNAIERGIHLTNDDQITWNDLFPDRVEVESPAEPVEIKINKITSLEDVVACAERTLLERVLRMYDGSRQIGKILGVSHTTVLNKLKKYELL